MPRQTLFAKLYFVSSAILCVSCRFLVNRTSEYKAFDSWTLWYQLCYQSAALCCSDVLLHWWTNLPRNLPFPTGTCYTGASLFCPATNTGAVRRPLKWLMRFTKRSWFNSQSPKNKSRHRLLFARQISIFFNARPFSLTCCWRRKVNREKWARAHDKNMCALFRHRACLVFATGSCT